MRQFPQYEGISRAVTWVLLSRETGFDVRALARRCGVGVRQLERDMDRDLASQPKPWLHEQRMVVARHLLNGPESSKWVAYQLGYKHPAHFCRDFKRCYEMTPGQFRTRIYHWRNGKPDLNHGWTPINPDSRRAGGLRCVAPLEM